MQHLNKNLKEVFVYIRRLCLPRKPVTHKVVYFLSDKSNWIALVSYRGTQYAAGVGGWMRQNNEKHR